ncbi:MAG: carbonic anhydrase, partial [Candidatus Hodarchaeota archaeon]
MQHNNSSLNAAAALQKLKEGNSRFVRGYRLNNVMPHRRQALVTGQSPFATILTCSDSRVPPEHIFDLGLGDLFVVRTAGNVIDSIALGSLEFGAEHLKTPLMLILGHTDCAAVTLACQGQTLPSYLKDITQTIQTTVNAVKKKQINLKGSALVNFIAQENIVFIINTVKKNSKL